MFGKRADALAPYLKKGMSVTVIGEIELRTYQKNDGTNGASLSMVCDKIAMQSKAANQTDQSGPGFGDDPGFGSSEEIPF